MAMDGIAIYANWVSRTVMPIAFLWINENRAEICESKGWNRLPDDINEVIEAAFVVAKSRDYYKEGRIEFYELQREIAKGTLRTEDINPTWTEICRRLRAEIDRQFRVTEQAKRAAPGAVQPERADAVRSSDASRTRSLTPA
jgi:hypothetical protein